MDCELNWRHHDPSITRSLYSGCLGGLLCDNQTVVDVSHNGQQSRTKGNPSLNVALTVKVCN